MGFFSSVNQSPSIAPIESCDIVQDVIIHVSKDLNVTSAAIPDSLITNAVSNMSFSLGESDEQHMERVRMGDDVKELTHLLAHDEVDLQRLTSPSVPISYDEHGMVQDDPTSLVPAMTMQLTSANGITTAESYSATDSTPAATDDKHNYPQLIKFLYQKDSNGLFNLTLLAISFSYVFLSVVNIHHDITADGPLAKSSWCRTGGLV